LPDGDCPQFTCYISGERTPRGAAVTNSNFLTQKAVDREILLREPTTFSHPFVATFLTAPTNLTISIAASQWFLSVSARQVWRGVVFSSL